MKSENFLPHLSRISIAKVGWEAKTNQNIIMLEAKKEFRM